MIPLLLRYWRILAALGVVLVLLAVAWAYGDRKYEEGYQKAENEYRAALIVQRANDATEHELELAKVRKERDDYAAKIATPIPDAPHARLCVPNRSLRMPAPSSTGPDTHAEPAVREEVESGPDIGSAIVTIGRDADAQVIALQEYVTNVCRPK